MMLETMDGNRDIATMLRNSVELHNKKLAEVQLERRQAANMRDWRMRKGLEMCCEETEAKLRESAMTLNRLIRKCGDGLTVRAGMP